MTRSICFFSCALALALLAQTSTTSAQERADWADPYFAAKLQLGFVGSLSAEFEAGSTTFQSQDGDLTVSFGLAGQYIHPLHKYFALGGLLGMLSWETTAGNGRNLLFDLAVLPQGKYAINDQIELYATIPLGLSIDILNEVNASNRVIYPAGLPLGFDVEGDTALGFVTGILFGIRYQLTRSIGLLAELGYMYRTFSHSLTVTATAGGVTGSAQSGDVSLSFGELALNLGAYF